MSDIGKILLNAVNNEDFETHFNILNEFHDFDLKALKEELYELHVFLKV